jgi:hypothetical protein
MLSCRFWWAFCQLDTLRKCRTTIQVRAALRSLPTTLDETYDRLLTGISENDRPYALRVLQWLAFSARPVTLEEVSEAMIVDLDCECPHVNADRALHNPRDIFDICTSLVILSPKETWPPSTPPKMVLQLAHYSVMEYLVSSRIADGPAAGYSLLEAPSHKSMAECSLAYVLQFDCLIPEEDVLSFRLAAYAARYWAHHARHAGDYSQAILRLGGQLLLPKSHRY